MRMNISPPHLDEVRKVKWRLLYAPLALEVLALEAPVPGDWH